MSRKYVLCPGYVTSSDGDEHYINANGLAGLYGVRLEDCMFKGQETRTDNKVIYLKPRSKGDYLEWLREQDASYTS